VAAWRTAERRLYGNLARRVIVKARGVRQGFRGAGVVRAHLSYLRRVGVTRDGAAARMFRRGVGRGGSARLRRAHRG
jgi:type IV secretory pathway VirD2 relaxase